MSHNKSVFDYFHPQSESIDNTKEYGDLNEDINLRLKTKRRYQGTGIVEHYDECDTVSLNKDKVSLQSSFKQWEGRIVEIEDENYFTARITEISGPSVSKIVRFDKRKVVFENIEQFEIGAPFYWKVGLFYQSNKMAVKRSEIRFKLLPPPNPILLREAEDDIRKIFDMISWMD